MFIQNATRTRLGGVREGKVKIKQTKVAYSLAAFAKEWSIYKLKSFIQSAKANAEHDFSLFYLDQRRKSRSV